MCVCVGDFDRIGKVGAEVNCQADSWKSLGQCVQRGQCGQRMMAAAEDLAQSFLAWQCLPALLCCILASGLSAPL